MNNDAQASAVPATETVVSPETSTVTAPHTAQATSAPVVFEVKSVVQVDARLEAGSNKPGGVARVVRVHQPGEAGADDAILYDVKYVLGGGERGVPARFVHAAEIEKQAGGEGAGTSRASRAARASPASASVVPATETVPSAAASGDAAPAARIQWTSVADLLALTSRIRSMDQYAIFHEPIDESEVSDYREVVQFPVDLQTLDEAIRSGRVCSILPGAPSQARSTAVAKAIAGNSIFGEADAPDCGAEPSSALQPLLELMFSNAAAYNEDGSFEYKQAKRVQVAASKYVVRAALREMQAENRGGLAAEDELGREMRECDRAEREAQLAERRRRARLEAKKNGGGGGGLAALREGAAAGAYFESDAPIFGAAHSKRGEHRTGPLDQHVRRRGAWGADIDARLCSGLHDIAKTDVAEHFRYPVARAVFPDYYEKITTPVDLNTMSDRLAARRYGCLEEVRRDFVLLHANCLAYNDAKAPIVKQAQKVRRLGEKLLARIEPLMREDQLAREAADARAEAEAKAEAEANAPRTPTVPIDVEAAAEAAAAAAAAASAAAAMAVATAATLRTPSATSATLPGPPDLEPAEKKQRRDGMVGAMDRFLRPKQKGGAMVTAPELKKDGAVRKLGGRRKKRSLGTVAPAAEARAPQKQRLVESQAPAEVISIVAD